MNPPFLTETEVARIYRQVYGGNRFSQTEREFAAEIEAAVREKFNQSLTINPEIQK